MQHFALQLIIRSEIRNPLIVKARLEHELAALEIGSARVCRVVSSNGGYLADLEVGVTAGPIRAESEVADYVQRLLYTPRFQVAVNTALAS